MSRPSGKSRITTPAEAKFKHGQERALRSDDNTHFHRQRWCTNCMAWHDVAR